MRGSRVKALRRQFIATFGRKPHGMNVIGPATDVPELKGQIVVAYVPSESRRLKKAYKEGEFDGGRT